MRIRVRLTYKLGGIYNPLYGVYRWQTGSRELEMSAREGGPTKLEEDSCTVEDDLILYPHTNRAIGETASSSQEIKILTVAYRFKAVQYYHAAR